MQLDAMPTCRKRLPETGELLTGAPKCGVLPDACMCRVGAARALRHQQSQLSLALLVLAGPAQPTRP
eukprot:scaffold11021_cov132-Isochrysis_galbana.AAC.3